MHVTLSIFRADELTWLLTASVDFFGFILVCVEDILLVCVKDILLVSPYSYGLIFFRYRFLVHEPEKRLGANGAAEVLNYFPFTFY